ncbi:helix-turn-helix transcriptional regulator [Streptomyces sp. P6-2-1]|uniref:helix-turn-helix transcriptional regulator n=1 Tax=unclassified Streptomyces TaxID=2593676 RepID=UPI003D364C08
MRDNEGMESTSPLADFLRSARARLAPQDVGLGSGGPTVRRVPGLRRDEVALLAGMSADYYTRMEQGRVTHASDAIVNGLCEALRLNETERDYLFTLFSPRAAHAAPRKRAAKEVRPVLRQMMDQMDDTAAFVVGAGMEVLAMNDLAIALLHDFTKETGLSRSLARWAFLTPEGRAFYLDWDAAAADMAAILRRDATNRPDDRHVNELIGELSVKSAEFRRWWSQHKVYQCSFGTKRLMHPLVGELHIAYETFPVPGKPEQQLFLYTAEKGSPSADALRILASWGSEASLADSGRQD